MQALGEYLEYYSVNAPSTLIKHVKMLMPGHYAEWDANGLGLCATTINNARYVAITASSAGGPLACPRAYLGVKIRDLISHQYIP